MNKKMIITLGVGTAAAVGIGIAGTSLASADPQPSATSSASVANDNAAPDGASAANSNSDPSKPMRSDETLLTGDVATKVTAAAKAKEPTATVQRVETDSDGVYEAHMVRADGTQIVVQIDKSFVVTEVQEMGQGGGHGAGRGPGGPSDGTSGAGSTSPTDANGTSGGAVG